MVPKRRKQVLVLFLFFSFICGFTWVTWHPLFAADESTEPALGKQYFISSVSNGKCISSEKQAEEDRTRAVLRECSEEKNQNVIFSKFAIFFEKSQKCLELENGNEKNGSLLREADCKETSKRGSNKAGSRASPPSKPSLAAGYG